MSSERPDLLRGRTFIVTGAASGIGRATALMLAERGCNLALTDRHTDGGREIYNEIRELNTGKNVIFSTLDVSDDEAVGKLVRNLRKHLGVIHGLVNCASIRRYTAPSHLTEMEKYDEMLATNSRGTFSFCQHFIKLALDENINRDPEFFPGGFAIVNVSSAACLTGTKEASAYAASKAAVIAMSKSMAQEYASKDKGAIRVNVVAPGATEKPFVQKMFDVTRVPSVEQALADVPMGRHGDPEEVASAILFLLSPDAGYITGVTLPVDGGWSS